MANAASNKVKYVLATAGINFSSDTFKMILMASGFSFNVDTHEKYSDVSAYELTAGNGYTAGGKTMTGVTVTEDDANDMCDISWSNVTWTASGGPIGPSPGAIIYDDTHADDIVVGFIDFGGNYTQPDGGTLTIVSPKVRIV